MESDHAIEYSRHGIAEHHEIYSLIEKLEETDKSSSAFHENTARACSSPFVWRRINCMNKKIIFKHTNNVLDSQQKVELADDYKKEMKE
jgi:hypothetical protein